MKNTAFLLVILVLSACGNGKVDTSKLQEELKAREIRVIPEATIIEKALSLGDSLVQTLDVTEALSQAGQAVKTWKVAEVSMSAIAFAIDGTYQLAEKEAGLLAAYRYNAENNIAADPNTQSLEGDIILYNAPIMQEGKLVGMWSVPLPRKYVILSIQD